MKAEQIFEIVRNYFGLTEDQMRERTRSRDYPSPLIARQICCYFCKECEVGEPLQIIADMVGQKHSTVLHSYKIISNYRDTNDRKYIKHIDILEKRILGKMNLTLPGKKNEYERYEVREIAARLLQAINRKDEEIKELKGALEYKYTGIRRPDVMNNKLSGSNVCEQRDLEGVGDKVTKI